VTSVLEKIDSTTVKLTVNLTAEEFAPSLAHAYQHIGESVSIPGFRKGKVPTKLLEQRIGKGPAIEHAVNESIPEWYAQAVEEHGVRPYGPPQVELTKLPGQHPGDEGVSFEATIEVRPEVSLPAVGDITLTIDAEPVTDEDVEARLTTLRERFGSLVGVDRPAADGDFVTLDLSAVIDGKDVDAVQGTSYQVGLGNMLEGLDEAITGLSAGEETSYEGPLAAGDHAGEIGTITVKVTAVKARELPAADDDFAQLASEFDTLAELRDDLRNQAERISVNNHAVAARDALLEHLLDSVSFELPRKVIEAEVHQHLEGEGRLEDAIHRAEVTLEAEKALRAQIVLDQLTEDLDIDVEQHEMLEYLVNSSRQYGMDPNTFIEQVSKAGQIPSIITEVARSKATAFALRRLTVKDQNGKAVDLTGVIGTVEQEVKKDDADAPKADHADDAEASKAAKAGKKAAKASKKADAPKAPKAAKADDAEASKESKAAKKADAPKASKTADAAE